MRNRGGIHAPNGNCRDFAGMVGMGVSNFTLLHHQSPWIPQLRAAAGPDGTVHVRFFSQPWPSIPARTWAEQCAKVYQEWRYTDYGVEVSPANEQNLPAEGGGWSADDYKRIADYNAAWFYRFRELTGCPVERTHYPATAQGHSDDQNDLGYVGYEIMRPAVELFGVLDQHQYWLPGRVLELVGADGRLLKAPEQWSATERDHALYNGPFRFILAHNLFPSKPIFISEAGQFDTARPDAPEEFVRWFKSLSAFPYVRGATPFIWEDPSGAHHQNNWSRNPAIARAVKAWLSSPTPVPPTPEPEPAPPEGGDVLLETDIGGVSVYDVRDRFPEVGGLFPRRSLGAITTCVMHHSATPSPTVTVDQALAVLDAIQRYHTQSQGWPACAYHLAIDQAGRIWWCNGLNLTTYHATVANGYSVGVCWLGTYTDSAPNAAMVAAAKLLWRGLEKHLGHSLKLIGHREVEGGTVCPGSHWEQTKQAMLGTTPPQPSTDLAAVRKSLDGLWGYAEDIEAKANGALLVAAETKKQIALIKQALGM